MKRIDSIIAAITGIEHTEFNDMQLEEQVSIVYSMAQAAHNGLNWWTQRSSENDATTNPDFIDRCEDEIANAEKALMSHCAFLNRAANWVEATIQNVAHDHASINIDSGAVDGDEVVSSKRAVKSSPYAWARTRLIESGAWIEHDDKNMPLYAYNLEQACERVAGRYIGRMIIGYLNDDAYTAQKTDGRDFIIMSGSKAICELGNTKSKDILRRKVLELAMKYPPFINDKPYTKKEINEAWTVLAERDEDDAAAKEVNDAVKEVKSAIRDAIKTVKIAVATEKGAEELKKAGASAASIDLFKEQITKAMSA